MTTSQLFHKLKCR